jgi:hypothetical protein
MTDNSDKPTGPTPPPDPFTALAAGAAGVHEMYVSFLQSGFSESHAIYLVASMMCGGPKPPA